VHNDFEKEKVLWFDCYGSPYTAGQDAIQTTFMSSQGALNWNMDLNQRWFAQEAKNRGRISSMRCRAALLVG
jgi:hypothetical protein